MTPASLFRCAATRSPRAPQFLFESRKFGVSSKAEGVQRLASDLSAARAALHLESIIVSKSLFQSPDDIPKYTRKLTQYLTLVRGFTESRKSATKNADAALQASVSVTDATVDCSGCLSFCRWQDALTSQTLYARSARQEYAHVLLACGILMMRDAGNKVDAILSERLSELDETQLKLAYQLLLHAAGVLEAGARSNDLEMLKRVPDLAAGRFPQLLVWIALAEAQELVVLRGVTREVADYTLLAKLSVDISARYKECMKIASMLLTYSTSITAERVRLYCAYKEPYYQAMSTYFQGAACMQKEDARNCVQAVANLKKASVLFEAVGPLEKRYEGKMAADKEEKERVTLLSTVFLRSQQIISRDLDIVTHRNDSVYYEPATVCNALSLVKPTKLPAVTTSDLWRDGEVANCLKPTAVVASDATTENQQQGNSRPREGCCSSCIIC
ncbi:uncharacterized protein PITG_17693 [Phytophthora infestans T30-4]|uniref:BRO1 domain-containing protein n=1 Tax=Phytophthora infestans (strain T30-4) TaxID=403677 RepID=D0NYG2_PHYIT|nr:uncharacterized protein PITG_17693 [Phytophthora infestans T30-4]EEY68579.1 conserved hypothetical protein [Phytophthora infestans T30-4]|eukprot:XP_002997564.1 conserved hypothetical protein [Phytophthora infestans T30-4]